MKYKRFEELPCWIKARELCQAVYELINLPGFRKDFGFRNQIWDAAGSVMDNIAEGFEDSSTKEFVKFLGYSQRSCSEVQSQLYRAIDCGYIDKKQFQSVSEVASEYRKQIKGFRKYLRDYDSKNKNQTSNS